MAQPKIIQKKNKKRNYKIQNGMRKTNEIEMKTSS